LFVQSGAAGYDRFPTRFYTEIKPSVKGYRFLAFARPPDLAIADRRLALSLRARAGPPALPPFRPNNLAARVSFPISILCVMLF